MSMDSIYQKMIDNDYQLSYEHKDEIIKLYEEIDKLHDEKEQYYVGLLIDRTIEKQIKMSKGVVDAFEGTIEEAKYKLSRVREDRGVLLSEEELPAAIMLKEGYAKRNKEIGKKASELSKMHKLKTFFIYDGDKKVHVKDASMDALLKVIKEDDGGPLPQGTIEELRRRGTPVKE